MAKMNDGLYLINTFLAYCGEKEWCKLQRLWVEAKFQ